MSEQRLDEKIIGLLILAPSRVQEIQDAVPPKFFLNPHNRTIYEALLAHYWAYNAVPTYDVAQEVARKAAEPKNAELYAAVVQRCYENTDEADVQHLSFYFRSLEDAWKKQELEGRLMEAVTALKDRGDPEEAIRVLQQDLPQARTNVISGELFSGLTAAVGLTDDKKAYPEKYAGIPMGLVNIDVAARGHARGEFIVMVGGTGVGKSLTLGQVAVNVARRGKRVLLITVENSKESYMNRLYSNIAQVEYWKFKVGKLDEMDKQKWLAAMADLPKDYSLTVAEFPEGCSAKDIWFYMKGLAHEVDYLIVDQITNMLPNNPRDFKPMTWLWYGQIALELKRLAGYAYNGRGIPVLSAAQAAGGTVGKKELSTDEVAMGKIILHHSHAALYITKDDKGQYHMGASKYRDAYIPPFPIFPEFHYWTIRESMSNTGTAVPPTDTAAVRIAADHAQVDLSTGEVVPAEKVNPGTGEIVPTNEDGF